MSQLLTLFWLRYTIFKNSLTGRGEVARRIFNAVILTVPLLLSIGIGIGLFVAIVLVPQFRDTVMSGGMTTVQATLLFLMLVSQSTGASSHFDPRRFTLFPLKLSKLYVLHLASALGEFSMLMVLPSMAGILLGLGFAFQRPWSGLLAFILAVLWSSGLFICVGVIFAWLLSGRKRSREIMFALLIGGMTVLGQVLPRLLSTPSGRSLLHWILPYREAIFTVASWTPIGVWSFFFKHITAGEVMVAYSQLFAVCVLWIGLAWGLGYVIFLRLATSAATGSSAQNKEKTLDSQSLKDNFLALRFPFLAEQTATILAKELKYFARNPATYLTVLSSLIFPLIMFRSFSTTSTTMARMNERLWWISLWMIFVFLMNLQYFGGLFAYDAAGFRQYLLAPTKWKRVLLGKNIAIWLFVSLQISLVLIGVQLLDHNITLTKIYVAVCSLLILTAIYSNVGNYMSIRFPYRVNFGVARRRDSTWSGVSLLVQLYLLVITSIALFVPIGLAMWLKMTGIHYWLLACIAVLCWGIYLVRLDPQGKRLEMRRFEIAEILTRKAEKL